MELWIRSQDKLELLKAGNIQIHEDEDKTIHIWSYGTLKAYLGQYTTKERALEVLDEIQNILIDYSKMSRVVYQMPNE